MVWENFGDVLTASFSPFSLPNNMKYRLYNPTSTTVPYMIDSVGYSMTGSLFPGDGIRIPDLYLERNIQMRGDKLLLQREPLNTAPTQPGAFTQPTGELEIGDTRTISWGASTDAEGNFNYQLEVSVNGGAWNNFVNTSTPTYSYVIPTATNLKFRVRASDSGSLNSPYRESPTYTVTKPKYYWSKYNVVTTYKLVTDELADVVNQNSFSNIYASYKFNTQTGLISPDVPSSATWENSQFFYTSFTDQSFLRYTKNASTVGKWSVTRFAKVADKTKGSLIQSGIIAIEGAYPLDGVHTDDFWYTIGSRVNQSIAPTGAFSTPAPATVLKPSQGVAVTFTASTAANISLYELEYRYNSGLWTTLGTNNTALTRSFTPTTDKTLTNVQFRVRAKNTSNVYSDYVYSEFYNIEHNAKPTITLATADNLVLTENTNIVIAGEARDTDNGNVLSVKYQVNSGNTLAIATAISNGTAPLAYTKTLQFRQGSLYDGATVIIDNLIAGQTYTVKTWAEDDQGGKSEVQNRSFTVVPNRAPILTVNAVTTQSNKINNDTMTITGSVSDPENQNIIVRYKINNGSLTQIYSGTGGNFTFNVKLGDTNDGENIIEIQATDTYDLLTTKKLKFTKTKNAVSLLKSSARYKATIPTTGITGVVAWFEKENGDLTIAPDLSMRNTGETEIYAAMTKSNTAPVNGAVTEDQYQLTVAAAKTSVVLRVTLTKATAASDKGIKKITGALQ